MLRLRLVSSTVLIIIGLFLIVNLTRSIIGLLGATDRTKETEKRVAELRFKNDELKRRLVEVRSPEFLEKIARDKLGLAKEGEIVVILPPYQPPSTGEQEEDLPNWEKWLRLFF